MYVILNKNIKIRKKGEKEFSLYDTGSNKRFTLNNSGYSILEGIVNRRINEVKIKNAFLEHRDFINDLFSRRILIKSGNAPSGKLTAFPETYPYWVEWLVTRKCIHNFNCFHCCYAFLKDRKMKELDSAENKIVVRKLASSGIFFVVLSGGDPFLRKDILTTTRDLTNNGIGVQIDTSGMFPENEIEKIENKDLLTIQVSIDGAKEETHNYFRQKKDSFLNAVKVVNGAKKYGLKVKVSSVLTRLNIGELKEMLQLLLKLEVGNWVIAPLRPFGNALLHYDKLRPPLSEQLKAVREIIKINNSLGSPIEIADPYPNPFLNKKVLPLSENTSICMSDRENKGIHILPDGSVSVCIYLSDRTFIGNLVDENMETIVKKIEKVDLWNLKVLDIPSCRKCKMANLCMGGCRAIALALTKNFLGCDLHTREIVKYFKPEN